MFIVCSCRDLISCCYHTKWCLLFVVVVIWSVYELLTQTMKYAVFIWNCFNCCRCQLLIGRIFILSLFCCIFTLMHNRSHYCLVVLVLLSILMSLFPVNKIGHFSVHNHTVPDHHSQTHDLTVQTTIDQRTVSQSQTTTDKRTGSQSKQP